MDIKEKGRTPAHPVEEKNVGYGSKYHLGISKRMYLASTIASGIMANVRTEPIEDFHFKNIVEDAYKVADELLRQEYL